MKSQLSILSIAAALMLISCNPSSKETIKNDETVKQEEIDKDPFDLENWNEEDSDNSKTFAELDKNSATSEYMTSEKKMKLINLKREMGMKFKAIGMNRSLSGYEKGRQKRELKIKYQQEIYKVLNEIPSETNAHNNSNANIDYSTINKKVYAIDLELDRLEDKYNAEKDKLEGAEDYMEKVEYKTKKDLLKSRYKQQKESLKRKRDSIIYAEINK